MDGVDLERPLEALHGPLRDALPLQDLAHPPARHRHLGRREGVGVVGEEPLQHRQRLPRVPARAQDGREPLQRRERGGVDLAGPPVGGERARGVSAVLPGLPQAAELPEQLARVPLPHPGNGGVEQAGHPGQVAARLEDVGEGQGGGEVIGNPRQRVPVESGDLLAGTTLELEEPGRLDERVGGAGRIVAVAGLGCEHLGEAGPVAGPGAEVGQRADGDQVSGLEREHLLVVGPGLGRVARGLRAHARQPEVEACGRGRVDAEGERLAEGTLRLLGTVERSVEQLTQLEQGPAPRRRIGLDGRANPEHVGQPSGVSSLPVAPLQGGGHVAVAGGDAVGRLEQAERSTRLALPVERRGAPAEQARPGRRGERIVLRDPGQAGGVGEERATNRLCTAGGVPAVHAAQHRQPEQQAALPLAARRLGRPLEERDDRGRPPVRGREPLQRRERALRRGVLGEGPPPGVPGPGGVVGAGLQHLGQFLEQTGPLRRLGEARDVELGDPCPGAPVAGLGVERAKRVEGGAAPRVAGEGLAERRGGLHGPAARCPVGGHGAPRLGALRPRPETAGLGLEHPRTLVRVARSPEDGAQPVEVGVAGGAERHGAPPLVDDGRHVAGGDERLGEGEPELPLGPRLEGDELPERGGQADEVALLSLEPAQGVEGAPVGLVPAGEPIPEPDREAGIAPAGGLGDPGERAQRRRVAWLGVEDPEVGVGCPPRARELLLAELRQDEEDAGALLRTRLRVGQRLERGGQLAEPFELPVEPLQRQERARGERGVEPSRLLVEVRRLGRAPERPLEERAEPERDPAPGLAQPREPVGEERGERPVPPGGRVGLLEDGPGAFRVVGHGALDAGERLAVAGMAGQHLLEEREGACGVVEVLLPERGQPDAEPVRLRVLPRVLGRGDLAGEDVGEERGVGGEELRLPRELLGCGERPGVTRHRLERGAQRAHRAAPVAETGHADPASAQPRVGGLLRAARPGGGIVALLVEELGHLAPRLACAVRVGKLVAGHLGDLPPELPPDAEVALQPCPSLQRRRERTPCLPGPVDGGQGRLDRDGGLVGQPLRERPGEDLGQPFLDPRRVGEPAQLGPQPRLGGGVPALERVLARQRLEGGRELPGPLAQPGQLGQGGGPLLGGHVLEPELEQVGELVLVSGGPVDLLEEPGRGGAGAGAGQRAGQAGERRALLRELLQHRRERVHREMGILHPLEQHGPPEQDLEPAGWIASAAPRRARRGPERAPRSAAPGRGPGREPPAPRRRPAPPRPACATRRAVRPRRRCGPGCAPTAEGSPRPRRRKRPRRWPRRRRPARRAARTSRRAAGCRRALPPAPFPLPRRLRAPRRARARGRPDPPRGSSGSRPGGAPALPGPPRRRAGPPGP